jgi:hypothetical protein
LLLVIKRIGINKKNFILQSILSCFSFSDEWIAAIELINHQTTPPLPQQLSNNNMTMVMNDDVDNIENKYPLVNDVFIRRPV